MDEEHSNYNYCITPYYHYPHSLGCITRKGRERTNPSRDLLSAGLILTNASQHLICEREQDQDNLFLSQVIYRYLITVILTVKLW